MSGLFYCIFSVSSLAIMAAWELLLLRSHQASQQTNFGRVRDLPGLPAPEARFTLDICMFVCISLHLPRFQVV